jgi:5-methylcytosine-specific restriction endonuclease McrA
LAVAGKERRVTDSVRYRINGDNSILRSVLYDLWGYKCYFCKRPKDYNDIQIDHIIPQTVTDERLQQLATQFGLPAEFDVHDPRNLAPICSSCNGPGGKGDEDLGDTPVVLIRLRRAEKLRSTVIKKVQTFAVPGKTATALLLAKEADLSDPATRQAFEAHAPAVVQKLALLDEAKVEFVSFRTVEVQVDEDHYHPDLQVGISLRAKARRAATILEDVCGGVIEDVVQEPVIDLFQQIHERVQSDFEAIDDQVEPISAGPPVGDIRIDVDSIDFERNGSFFEFTFGGDFEASLSASLSRYSWDGSELEDLQGDAFVTGRYSFVASWNSSKGGEVDAGDCYIDPWDCDIHAPGAAAAALEPPDWLAELDADEP